MKRELFPEPVEDTRNRLYECPDCESDQVEPIRWGEIQDENCSRSWQIICRCPNCFWTGEGVHSLDKINDLEEKLDDDLMEIKDNLTKITHENMSDWVERFVTALNTDLILPEDF